MKIALGIYLAIYTVFLALLIVLPMWIGESSVSAVLHTITLLIPCLVMFSYLKGKLVHFGFSVIGLIAIYPPLSEAHLFRGFSVVEQAMYALLAPMAIFMVFQIYVYSRRKT